MSDISNIENIEWRTPDEDDLERLDFVLNEIVFVQSSESSVSYTATISQGDTVLKNIYIYGKKHPEVNSNVLLFMFNNDSWTVGVV